jgi:hypothetical protein
MLPMFRGIRRKSDTFKPAIYIGQFGTGHPPSSAGGQVGDMVIAAYRDEGDQPAGSFNRISLDDIAGYPGCSIFWKIVTAGDVSSSINGGQGYFIFRGPKTLRLALTQAIYASTLVVFGPFARSNNHSGFLSVVWAATSTMDASNPTLTSSLSASFLGAGSYDYGYTNRTNMQYYITYHISPEYNGQTFNLTKVTPTADGVAGAILEMAS